MSRQTKGKRKGRQGKQDEERENLAFKVLSAENTKKLADIDDVDELEKCMVEVLQIPNHTTDLKEGSVLDYFVAGVWWGKEQGYSHEQLSAFFTVIHTLLDHVKEKQLSLTDSLKEFKKMLTGIGQDASEGRVVGAGLEHLFDVTQAKAFTDYIYNSLFQHYKLFEFLFGHTQAEEIIGTDLEVEVPLPVSMPWPPPLDEGIPEAIYLEHIATPPPTPEVKEEEQAAGGEGDAAADGDRLEDLEASEREREILAQLSVEEVQLIMDSVFQEVLGGYQTEVAVKLRDKENGLINRINKIHNVA